MSLSKKITEIFAQTSFEDCLATIIGCGSMGREYVKALQALGVPSIQICSKSEPKFERISQKSNIQSFAGGYLRFKEKARPGELAIIATPTADLIPTTKYLRELGFRRFLIEKPIAISSLEIQQFQKEFLEEDFEVVCAYNRTTYPSFLEAKYWLELEGGITSCHYSLTEIIGPDWTQRFPKQELQCWGIANSLHVASMAHGLIGMPKEWKSFQSGKEIFWHPSGSVFVGSGVSEKGIPFSYHADWTSTGRWSVEIHTKKSSYLFCPLEKLQRRTSFKEPWVEIPIHAFDERVKVGIVEEVAAMLQPSLRQWIPLYSLEEVIKLTQFGEKVFGYVS